MKTVNIHLYEFNELSEQSKRKAIEEHKNFLDSIPVDIEIDGELKKEYIYHTDEDVINSIESNEYMFFCNGDLADVCEYVAGPKKGVTEFKFKGETLSIVGWGWA